MLFASCKKTTPRYEQKSDTSPEVTVQPDDPKKDTPQPDTPDPPKNDPPTPAPPKVDPPKSEEPKLEVLQPGVVRITNLAPGGLASTFHKNNFNDADRKKVTKLIIQSGGLSQADLTYIRHHLKAFGEICLRAVERTMVSSPLSVKASSPSSSTEFGKTRWRSLSL